LNEEGLPFIEIVEEYPPKGEAEQKKDDGMYSLTVLIHNHTSKLKKQLNFFQQILSGNQHKSRFYQQRIIRHSKYWMLL
jgi:hypothetical protein